MKNRFNILSVVLLAFAVSLFGCGGGGGSSTPPPDNDVPSISNLSFSPTSAHVGDGGGAVTVTGSYNFIDPDGDISTINIHWVDTLGHSGTISGAANLGGATVGTGVWAVVGASTAVATTYSFDFYVIDSIGNISNHLTGTWIVS